MKKYVVTSLFQVPLWSEKYLSFRIRFWIFLSLLDLVATSPVQLITYSLQCNHVKEVRGLDISVR